MSNLFYLLALSALTCSANLLDKFTPFTDMFPHNIAFSDHNRYNTDSIIEAGFWVNNPTMEGVGDNEPNMEGVGDNESNMESIIIACAERCLIYTYHCNSFAVTVNIQTQDAECLTFRTKSSEITYSINEETPSYLLAVYDAKDTIVEAVAATILGDREILEGPRAEQLLMKYGFRDPSKQRQDGFFIMLDLLRRSKAALHANPPTEVYFNKWLGGNTLADSQRESSEICRIIRDVQPSPTCSRIRENISSAPFNTLVLLFLDSISQGVGITTVFDPLAQILFIEGPDIHMLVVSFGYGAFALARILPNGLIDDANQEIPLEIHYFLTPEIDFDYHMKSSVLEMFEKAMSRFGHKAQFSSEIDVDFQHYEQFGDEKRNGFAIVLSLVSFPTYPELLDPRGRYRYYIDDRLMGGLMNAVVSSVYRNQPKPKRELLRSNILRTLKVGSLADINIITTTSTPTDILDD